MNKKHLATMSILTENRKKHAEEINKILSENGNIIIARMGVNLERYCIENYSGIITLILEASPEEINAFIKKLEDQLPNIIVKIAFMTK